MTKTRLLAIVMFVLVGLITGCSETKYVEVSQQAPAATEKGSFYIDMKARTQKVVLPLEGGYITGLMYLGTMKYEVKNIAEVNYVSSRQFFKVVPEVSADGKSVSLSFANTINNDKPQIILIMDDGEQYPVDQLALQLHSDDQVRYQANEWGFEYGHEERTYVKVIRNVAENTITFNVFFGCDKLVGLVEDADPSAVGGIAWQLEDGTIHPGTIMKNEFGSFYASATAPLVQQVPAPMYGEGPSTTGQLAVFSKSGLRIPFATWKTGFDWEYDWDSASSLTYMNPYWDQLGREGIMKFYVHLDSWD